ncbi:MAG: hypothetical protein J07HN4v3_01829 [Halonotius sp. J07HN4]|nr:MAG: hypothetical protein J07HN4v3_01829 [Halonotius sp. J07HN4]
MGYSNHGPTHIEIVRNRSLGLYTLLKHAGINFNVASDHGLDNRIKL